MWEKVEGRMLIKYPTFFVPLSALIRSIGLDLVPNLTDNSPRDPMQITWLACVRHAMLGRASVDGMKRCIYGILENQKCEGHATLNVDRNNSTTNGYRLP